MSVEGLDLTIASMYYLFLVFKQLKDFKNFFKCCHFILNIFVVILKIMLPGNKYGKSYVKSSYK